MEHQCPWCGIKWRCPSIPWCEVGYTATCDDCDWSWEDE